MTQITDTFLHYREGKTQSERFLEQLNPENLELNDLDVADWLLFAFNFAQHVNYFDKDSPEASELNWQDFFDLFDLKKTIQEDVDGADNDETVSIPRRENIVYTKLHQKIEDELLESEKEGTLSPHLVLFVSFLKVLEYSKGRFNDLTKRHLDFYYGEVLQIEKREAVEDRAYIIFELAKRAVEEKVAEGTALDGKKDTDGNNRSYKLTEDLIVNQTKVEEIKSFLKDDLTQELKMAPVANSIDGIGGDFNEETEYWWPFGYNSKEENYEALPDAKLGFAVASPILNLKGGTRVVNVRFTYHNTNAPKEYLDTEVVKNNLEILCSTEEGWLAYEYEYGCSEYQSSDDDFYDVRTLSIYLTFPKDFAPIVPYKDAGDEGFTAEYPVLRFFIKGDESHQFYSELTNLAVSNVSIDVNVQGITEYTLENDNGSIDIAKPFYPFTAQPIVGSNFTIKSPEIFNTYWFNLSVKIKWKNTPNSFSDHYKAYITDAVNKLDRRYFGEETNSDKLNSVVTEDDYFKANVFLSNLISSDETWTLKDNLKLFKKNTDDNTYETDLTVYRGIERWTDKSDSLRISLEQSFLQELFPALYTLTLGGTDKTLPIPSEPYIPLIESIEIGYRAIDGSNRDHFNVYLEDAFGAYQEDTITSIVPKHEGSGELYLGLRDALPGQQVSLLIQNVEGSENPLEDTFTEDEEVKWEVLSNNKWLDLSELSNIISNETNNFLQSGIIKFQLPSNLNTDNTRLNSDLIWVRASMNRSYDAVSKTQGIFAQAVIAEFENNNNELSHLEEGLPANTIEKLKTRVPKIKSVVQPYNSIGGLYEEADLEYYRRISERLRHKNRAITQWDYEHLILQNFPDIFKVKCLNHTSDISYLAPGYVTVIVVPNTRNKNIFDIYKPRVSKNTITEISNLVNSLNTMHVDAIVINPEYQEIKVEIVIKFHQGFDENFYGKQLDEDIKSFISPWAFANTEEISFGVAMNKFQMIDYIDRLPYVDYIDGLVIKKDGEIDNNVEIQANPKSILVSAKEHLVTISTRSHS